MRIILLSYRTVSFDVPPQEILTKDSVTVAVDAVVYYNIRWFTFFFTLFKFLKLKLSSTV